VRQDVDVDQVLHAPGAEIPDGPGAVLVGRLAEDRLDPRLGPAQHLGDMPGVLDTAGEDQTRVPVAGVFDDLITGGLDALVLVH